MELAVLLLVSWWFLDLLLDPEDGGITCLRDVGKFLPMPRRQIPDGSILHRLSSF